RDAGRQPHGPGSSDPIAGGVEVDGSETPPANVECIAANRRLGRLRTAAESAWSAVAVSATNSPRQSAIPALAAILLDKPDADVKLLSNLEASKLGILSRNRILPTCWNSRSHPTPAHTVEVCVVLLRCDRLSRLKLRS